MHTHTFLHTLLLPFPLYNAEPSQPHTYNIMVRVSFIILPVALFLLLCRALLHMVWPPFPCRAVSSLPVVSSTTCLWTPRSWALVACLQLPLPSLLALLLPPGHVCTSYLTFVSSHSVCLPAILPVPPCAWKVGSEELWPYSQTIDEDRLPANDALPQHTTTHTHTHTTTHTTCLCLPALPILMWPHHHLLRVLSALLVLCGVYSCGLPPIPAVDRGPLPVLCCSSPTCNPPLILLSNS